ncbi:unnamed protein product, partial [Amoebophrya sp. A120]
SPGDDVGGNDEIDEAASTSRNAVKKKAVLRPMKKFDSYWVVESRMRNQDLMA